MSAVLSGQAAAPSYVRNKKLIAWVADMARLTQPDRIVWCDGSQAEYDRLCDELVQSGTFKRLNPAKRPNSFLALSRPERRGARRGPHLHLQRAEGRRRPDEQLDGARARCARR